MMMKNREKGNTQFFCCVLGGCEEPDLVPHSTSYGTRGPYMENHQMIILCESSYTGGGIITCQSDGKWSPNPVCTGKELSEVDSV